MTATAPDPAKWTPASRAAFLASEAAQLNGFTAAHLDAYERMHSAWKSVEFTSSLSTASARERRDAAYAAFRRARADYKRMCEATR